KGLLVTVFTNGTLITDSILALFQNLPPHVVEISLYGATAATYENITGVAGSYERCLDGIKRLLGGKIRVRLKTILMTMNSHEFADIEDMAREFGVKFRFDAAIFPCANGDKSPLNLRVAPSDAVDKEFSDRERARVWKDYMRTRQEWAPTDSLYQCGAGLTGFHIDPYGYLQPCLMTRNMRYDLSKGSFLSGWNGIISGIRNKKARKDFACYHCDRKDLCGFCPAFFEFENGAEDARSEYLCAMGKNRFSRIHDISL
ncbi:MAG TPA: radical SAM protein, partial [Thermodesulfovibrionales bacterium]|nr:radical SAM protein [Thermodesulfovibrionales bacterium]